MSNAGTTVGSSTSEALPSPSPDLHGEISFKRRNVSERTRAWIEDRAPMMQLPATFVVALGYSPPKVCFGFGVSPDLVYKYALKKGLVDKRFGKYDPAGSTCLAFHKAVIYLEHLTRAHKLETRIPVSLDQIYVISLYDNYTKEKDEMLEEDEKEVLEMLREELGLPEDEPAMWYYEHP